MSRHLACRIALALAVVTPGLALGAVHAAVLAAYVGLAAVMLVLNGLGSRRAGGSPPDLAAALLLGMIAFTALQLIPLPAGLVELLSPAAHEVRARALAPLGAAAPAWMPLTLDRTLTMT